MNLKLFTVTLLMVAVASSVALTGCKKKDASPEQAPEQTTTTATPEQVTTTETAPAEQTTTTTTTEQSVTTEAAPAEQAPATAEPPKEEKH